MNLVLIAGLALLGLVGLVAVLGMSQSVGASEERRRLGAVLNLWPGNGHVTLTGTVTNASADITAPSSLAGLQIGMVISGVAIPAGTTIINLDSVTPKITMSANATGTHAAEALSATYASGTAEIHLYKSAFVGGVDPDPSDFTEADFDTYAAKSMGVAPGVYSNPDGTAEADFGDFAWILFADPVVSNTIYGYWIDYVYPAGGVTRVVAAWEDFPTPIQMNANGRATVCTVPMKLPEPGAVVQP